MTQLVGYPMAVVGDTSVVHDSALNPVGLHALDSEGNEYVYLPGVASTTAGSWVSIGASNATARLTSAMPGPVAVAMAAIVADKYGWYQIRGWNSIALAASDGTIASGGGELMGTESLAAKVKQAVGDSFNAPTGFIFGAFAYSAQPDSDSAAAGTPGADLITVFLNYPYISAVAAGYSSTGAAS